LINKIEFKSKLKGFIPDPKPAKFFIPEAYKKMASRLDDNFNTGTLKSCIPFLDAYTTGYIIPFPTDIRYYYHKEKDQSEFVLHKGIPLDLLNKNYIGVQSHTNSQTNSDLRSSKRTIDHVFKFINPWNITTPKGYSCLFVNPFNKNLPFELVTGIVDTDDYEFQIHFPFYWTNNVYESFILKQGSPMVLVIPFKRESWKMNVEFDKRDVETKAKKQMNFFSTFMDNYKTRIWKKKSFK